MKQMPPIFGRIFNVDEISNVLNVEASDIEQGYEIGRPSLIYLRGEEKIGEIEVLVGGKVQMVAKGEILDE